MPWECIKIESFDQTFRKVTIGNISFLFLLVPSIATKYILYIRVPTGILFWYLIDPHSRVSMSSQINYSIMTMKYEYFVSYIHISKTMSNPNERLSKNTPIWLWSCHTMRLLHMIMSEPQKAQVIDFYFNVFTATLQILLHVNVFCIIVIVNNNC